MNKENLIIPSKLKPCSKVKNLMKEFIKTFSIYEIENGGNLIPYFDHKSSAYYLICHLQSQDLIKHTDLEATLELDNEDDVIYKLNREITEDQAAFIAMEEDIEYDKSYRPLKPLKVYGGQHRLRAITNAQEESSTIFHGIRVYFDLDRNQKVEIATINNTSIAVPNDLLDRMREQLLGSELREWCQKVDLLNPNQDFSDRKSPDVPTVRIARTILINYYVGKEKELTDFHQPIIAKSGGDDEKYLEIRAIINWDDTNLIEMGKQFAKLHKIQRQTIINRDKDNFAEFARKVLSLAVVSSWSYAAGLFQNHQELIKILALLPITTVAIRDK